MIAVKTGCASAKCRYRGTSALFAQLQVNSVSKIKQADSSNNLPSYWVQLTGVGITTPDGVLHTSSIAPNPVLLDSGTSIIVLPPAVVVAVGQLFSGAQYDPGSRMFVVDCANVGAPGTIDFTFGGKVIRVPYSELIYQGGDQCLLLIQVDNESECLA